VIITEITEGTSLSPEAYDQLTCCRRPARIAHATATLPVAGAVCDQCMCVVTSAEGYGAVTVGRCTRHPAS
jgi:hypothetical protein